MVEDVPGYFKIEEAELPKNVSQWRIKQYPGFLINFEGVNSLNEYLAVRFGRSSRYKLRREQKKLEQCFDITYKMYFGEISRSEYDFIFDEFYKLLAIRSLEKGIKNNVNISQRDHYQEIVYPMILNKKASFYIIYNGKMPIDICLNFHLNNVIFQYIRTYDIAYSKFNTGYTDLMKQIEWCIANEVKLISFSKGDFYWKRRWCNTVYDYDFHIFFKSTSIVAAIKASIFWCKRGARQFLREKKVIEWYHAKRDKYSKSESHNSQFEITKITSIADLEKLEKIDYNLDSLSALKRTIFEFLYDTEENEADIVTYQEIENNNNFIVAGKKNTILIKKLIA
ncbi:GNAT family N-acetyltransferase [Aurantibacter crassamenti]|uniref:GNAT family N-acetyltransferase n=1 Tax=Aurantibacter crassamenti TaxID=1837375 RepID=UPI001939B234|nr:GNAT family N-acetyltransferase [Aurantibacter crassamenti]MBM1106750.1 GNAT family N-acetyltransferase [Aurantibacter crassamenti]